jgi:hypothetical protein
MAGIVLLLCLPVQAALDFTFVNVLCSVVAAIVTMATWTYAFGMRRLDTHPISTLALLGLNFITLGMPIIFQTLFMRAITYNLQSPLLTFWACATFTAVVLIAHLAFTHSRLLQGITALISRRLWAPLWIFYPPSNFQLWLIGGTGFAATLLSKVVYGSTIEYGDVGGKFLQTFNPFIAAPFFMLFRGSLTLGRARHKRQFGLLLLYFVAIVVMAVLMNARGVFASIMLLVLLSYGLALLSRRLVLSGRALGYLCAAGIALIPVMLAAQDLATAMVIARQARSTQNLSYVFRETVSAYGDKEALARYRKQNQQSLSTGGLSGYSEAYFESEFLGRLSITKFTDLTITVSRRFGASDRAYVREVSMQQFVAQLPTPALRLLGIDLDKRDFEFSTGDVYEAIASNRELGSRLTGSTVTTVRDLSPWLWPLIVIPFSLFVFVMTDSLVITIRGMWSLSVPGFMLLPPIFQASLVGDSLSTSVGIVTRTLLTVIIVYSVLLLIGRLFQLIVVEHAQVVRPS